MSDRFVILQHLDPSGEHWDFMLERGHVLLTWRLAREPTAVFRGKITCQRINDHRKKYLSYEGLVSGGRGVVSRVDEGTYTMLRADGHMWSFDLKGRHLNGEYRIVQSDRAGEDAWHFVSGR